MPGAHIMGCQPEGGGSSLVSEPILSSSKQSGNPTHPESLIKTRFKAALSKPQQTDVHQQSCESLCMIHCSCLCVNMYLY